MAEVFISYSSVDKAAADEVCEALERSEISCWIAPRDIGVGSYASAIIKGIQDCKLLVLIFSSHSNKSPQVEREIERAVSKDKTIYPLRIENVVPSPDLELFISSEQWMDAFEPPLSDHLDKFCRNVKDLLGRANATDIEPPAVVAPLVVRPSRKWTILSALAVVLGLALVVSTILKLQRGGFNTVYVGGVVAEIFLLAAAATTLSARAGKRVEQLLTRIRLHWKFQGPLKLSVACAVLLLIGGVRVLLPATVTRHLNSKGEQALNDKQYATAISNYEAAVRIDPSSRQSRLTDAHFELAVDCDKAHDYPCATAEYERTIKLNPDHFLAQNNLARVLILYQKDYNGALRRLDYLRTRLAELPAESEYYIFKNRGWANLELHNYRQAQDDLGWALVKHQGAAANYLLARVHEEQGHRDQALGFFELFLAAVQRATDMDEQVEPEWIAHAQEQLTKGH